MAGDFVLRIDGIVATALSEAEFIERVGGRKGSVCVLQLDRDDGGGQSHVVNVSVHRDGAMDEEQLQVQSSYTGMLFCIYRLCHRFIIVSCLHHHYVNIRNHCHYNRHRGCYV